MIKKLSLLLFVSIAFLIPIVSVFADDITPPAEPPVSSEVIDFGSLNPLGSACKDLECILKKILDFALTIVMAIMPFIILYGAYQIMTAGGDPKQFQTGGKTILYASIGFIIALLAKNLVSILLDVVNTTVGS